MAEPVATSTAGWLPALTALLGFLTAIVTDSLKDFRTHKRERETREATRRDTVLQKRNDFQRQTLLNLQRAAQKLMKCSAEMQLSDVMASRAGKAWQKQYYPTDLNTRAHEAAVETTILGVRVLDDTIRELLNTFKQQQAKIFCTSSEAEGEQLLNLLGETFVSLNNRIGEVLRSIDSLEMD